MRVTIVSIGAAAFSKGKDAEALIATWSERTAAQAVEILGKADVKVTNKKDKEKLLPLLLKFEAALKAKKAIVPFWVEVAALVAPAQRWQLLFDLIEGARISSAELRGEVSTVYPGRQW